MPDVTTYSGVHARLRRIRGAASAYECACGAPAAEWAYTHDDPCPNETISPRGGEKYSTDLNRYKPMCRRCHRLYDKAAITHCPRGHLYAGDNLIVDAGKRKCRTCVYARNRRRKPSADERQRKNELQRLRRKEARRESAAFVECPADHIGRQLMAHLESR